MLISRRELLWGAAAQRAFAQASGSAAAAPGTRRALVVGIQDYPSNRLQNTLNDAADITDALKSARFSVVSKTNLSRAAFQDAFTAFLKIINPGDTAVFYYAGHGMQINNRNYLVPTSFSLSTPEDEVKNQCLDFDDIQNQLEASRASVPILIVDACRNNPYPAARSWERGFVVFKAKLGSYTAFSASPGQTASDNPSERNGLFTKHLLTSLSQPVPVSSLFRDVRRKVFEASGERQLPWLQDQLLQEFYFVDPPTQVERVSAPSGSAGQIDEACRAQAANKCDAAWEILDRTLRRDPENAYVHYLAGLALECLGRHAQARERFNMAIELRPDYAAAYWARGVMYFNQPNYPLAIEDFDWAIEQDEKNSFPVTMRAKARFMRREYKEALADFDKAIALNPSDALALQGRAQTRERLGQYDDALTDALEAQKRDRALADLDADISRIRPRARR